MWLIIVGIVIIVFVLFWLFVRGADLKNCNSYAKMVEDEQQEKALAQADGEKVQKKVSDPIKKL